MVIDYENYKVFDWSDKQLKKHYSKEILDKYYKVLAYLYQNGYDINCGTLEEVEEQLDMWNYFKTTEDLYNLKNLYDNPIESDYAVGKKILSEELYDIVEILLLSEKMLTILLLLRAMQLLIGVKLVKQFTDLEMYLQVLILN